MLPFQARRLPLVVKHIHYFLGLAINVALPRCFCSRCGSHDPKLGENKDISWNSQTEMCLVPSRWPRTLAGIRAYLPCNRLPSSAGTYSGSSGEEQRAWRYCDRKGVWAEDDYSRCQFQKDVTRFLYVINQVCIWLVRLLFSAMWPHNFCSRGSVDSLLWFPHIFYSLSI